MEKLQEKQTLTMIRLSDAQKIVICNILVSDSDTAAYDNIQNVSTGNDNIAAAKKILEKLGLIVVDEQNHTARLTDTGNKVAEDEQLSSSGECPLNYNDIKKVKSPQPTIESFDLLKSINNLAYLKGNIRI